MMVPMGVYYMAVPSHVPVGQEQNQFEQKQGQSQWPMYQEGICDKSAPFPEQLQQHQHYSGGNLQTELQQEVEGSSALHCAIHAAIPEEFEPFEEGDVVRGIALTDLRSMDSAPRTSSPMTVPALVVQGQDPILSTQTVTADRQQLQDRRSDGSSGKSKEAVEQLSDAQADAMKAWLTRGNLEERDFAMQQIGLLMQRLCATQLGSRIVQLALDVANDGERKMLAESMRGNIREMARGSHANYVVQKCIDVVTPVEMQFMINELQGRAVVTARHRFGCRIIQRLIERCPSAQAEDLVDEILTDGPRLLRHPFANFVMQHILTYGERRHRSEILGLLMVAAGDLAKHHIASHVLQHALTHAEAHERDILSRAVFHVQGPGRFQTNRRQLNFNGPAARDVAGPGRHRGEM